MISQEAQNKENKNSESKYTSNSQSTQNIDFTQHTPQSPTPTPNQAINNPDALLTKDSLLFQPIDTLTQELFNTNFCPYLPKLYGIYKSVDEIDFSKLPQSFVLKTNHASGGVVPVPNKETFLSDSMGFEKAMDKLTKNLNINYYTLYREWHYKDIEPRIFAEEMLDCGKNSDDKKWEAPLDYKIHIMHDKIGYIEVAADSVRHHKELIVDTQYNEMPFDLGNRMDFLPEKPKDLDIMLDMARKLAYFTDYVRVDLYYVNNKIYVGELTFTNAGGADTFNPNEWDRKLGELWQPNLCKQYEACANNLLSCSKSL
ncbi:MAG: ATP-grasp fold amidoligase family protein [Helicobacter sp.]|uniref:ATP-grasp fold amidoligase family protein n=1 Tax=Helicobacter sp. TaxID=218 RepID=UPI002A90B6A8|nr:ATP-grasp fold amidoligase family protein [Helicobacter sp.]MDY5821399.1 ATP-grasp fold amidoligase family protein [Helicobacter sp.]